MISDNFADRHIGPRDNELPQMLKTIGVNSLDQLIEKIIPEDIKINKPLRLPDAMSEFEYLNHIRSCRTGRINCSVHLSDRVITVLPHCR